MVITSKKMTISFGIVIFIFYICIVNQLKQYTMKTAIVTKIKFDTDNKVVELPEKLTIEIPNEIKEVNEIIDFVSDEISNVTGFCHYGFEIELIKNNHQ